MLISTENLEGLRQRQITDVKEHSIRKLQRSKTDWLLRPFFTTTYHSSALYNWLWKNNTIIVKSGSFIVLLSIDSFYKAWSHFLQCA